MIGALLNLGFGCAYATVLFLDGFARGGPPLTVSIVVSILWFVDTPYIALRCAWTSRRLRHWPTILNLALLCGWIFVVGRFLAGVEVSRLLRVVQRLLFG